MVIFMQKLMDIENGRYKHEDTDFCSIRSNAQTDIAADSKSTCHPGRDGVGCCHLQCHLTISSVNKHIMSIYLQPYTLTEPSVSCSPR